MKIPKVESAKTYNTKDMKLALAYKNRQQELQQSLRQIILQKQNTKREEDELNKRLDIESVNHQNSLIDKFEDDQKYNMNTYVKHHYSKLKNLDKPNLSVASQIADKKFNDYVMQQVKNKQIETDYMHKLRESIRKKKLQEISDFNKRQMSENKVVRDMHSHHDKVQYIFLILIEHQYWSRYYLKTVIEWN